MCSIMVVCVLYPRFELLAALAPPPTGPSRSGCTSSSSGVLGDRRALLAEPVALAPEAGREQVVGEVSAPAEAFGVVRGMRLGEAMSRCPALRLVPPDPEGVRSLWHGVLDRLEAIGAEVESDSAGAAFFESAGLRGLHGGDLTGVLAAAGRALGPGARLGAAPCRFAAHAAALQARARRRPSAAAASRPLRGAVAGDVASAQLRGSVAGEVASAPLRGSVAGDLTSAPLRGAVVVAHEAARDFLSPLPVALLRTRPELQALPEVFERLGIRTLGEIAALPSRAVAERFGHPGLLALDLARGRDTPLAPRRPPEPVVERLDLPEAASGQQLERALELLVARVLARRERRGRALRGLAVSARFVAGGTWRTAVALRQASADPERIRLALGPKLADLPAPAESLALEVEAFGPPAHDQGRLLDEAAAVRRSRLGEAVRQARQAAGSEAALKVLDVDPGSRIPERRAVLAPFPEAPAP
jgi:protein ImuB